MFLFLFEERRKERENMKLEGYDLGTIREEEILSKHIYEKNQLNI